MGFGFLGMFRAYRVSGLAGKFLELISPRAVSRFLRPPYPCAHLRPKALGTRKLITEDVARPPVLVNICGCCLGGLGFRV